MEPNFETNSLVLTNDELNALRMHDNDRVWPQSKALDLALEVGMAQQRVDLVIRSRERHHHSVTEGTMAGMLIMKSVLDEMDRNLDLYLQPTEADYESLLRAR